MAETIQFFQTSLQRELLIAKIRANPTLKDVFKKKKNITNKIDEEITHRTRGILENWLILHVKGATGSLKSSVAMTIGKKIDRTFNHERIELNYEAFQEKINNSLPLQAFQLDEQIFSHGTGTTRIINDLANLIETLRKRQNSMIIVTPDLKYFPEDKFTYILETIDDTLVATCPHNPKPHEPRTCKCYLEKSSKITKAYVRLAVKKEDYYLGFYIVEIDWNNLDWQEYSKKKDEFIELMRQNQVRNHDYEKLARNIINTNDFPIYMKNKKSLAILIEKHHPNLTTNEQELIIEQIRILQRTGEA